MQFLVIFEFSVESNSKFLHLGIQRRRRMGGGGGNRR